MTRMVLGIASVLAFVFSAHADNLSLHLNINGSDAALLMSKMKVGRLTSQDDLFDLGCSDSSGAPSCEVQATEGENQDVTVAQKNGFMNIHIGGAEGQKFYHSLIYDEKSQYGFFVNFSGLFQNHYFELSCGPAFNDFDGGECTALIAIQSAPTAEFCGTFINSLDYYSGRDYSLLDSGVSVRHVFPMDQNMNQTLAKIKFGEHVCISGRTVAVPHGFKTGPGFLNDLYATQIR